MSLADQFRDDRGDRDNLLLVINVGQLVRIHFVDAALRPLSVRVKKLKPGAAGKTNLRRNAEMFGVSDGEAPSETDEASSCMD